MTEEEKNPDATNAVPQEETPTGSFSSRVDVTTAEDPAESPAESPAALPRYKCHKEVGAGKILGIGPINPDGSATLTLEGGISRKVDADFLATKKPAPGGYLIEYDDGYRSYSPAEPFESGYTLKPEPGVVV